MGWLKYSFQIVISIVVLIALPGNILASAIDWQKVKTLQGMAFVEYVQGLDLKGQAALNFWKNIR